LIREEERMISVLGMTFWGWALTVVAVALYIAGVIWLLIDVLRRPDFSGGKKALWVAAAFFFSLAALVVYLIFFRGWDDPLKRDD
jgi:hypothetical protein